MGDNSTTAYEDDRGLPDSSGKFSLGVCIVDEIVNHGVYKMQYYYRVKWFGWKEKWWTWEKLDNLDRDDVERYHLRNDVPLPDCYKDSTRTKDSVIAEDIARQLIRKYPERNVRVKHLRDGALKITLQVDPNVMLNIRNLDATLNAWQREINARDFDSANNGCDLTVENKVDFEGPPEEFTYISSYKQGKDVPELADVEPPFGCDCKEDCLKEKNECCASKAGVEFAYDRYGRVKIDEGRPIYECNDKCACRARGNCPNRVVQKGRKVPLCIFRTWNARGWGVKTLKALKAGEFVMEYVGEVITSKEAEARGDGYDREGRMCLFDLDYNETDANPYTVDAGQFSNVAYFVNHSCDPNMAVYPVWVNNLDPNLPRLAFFTTKDVGKNEELTCDYNSLVRRIETDCVDDSGAGCSKSELVKKMHPCRCGSQVCRGHF